MHHNLLNWIDQAKQPNYKGPSWGFVLLQDGTQINILNFAGNTAYSKAMQIKPEEITALFLYNPNARNGKVWFGQCYAQGLHGPLLIHSTSETYGEATLDLGIAWGEAEKSCREMRQIAATISGEL